MESREHQLEAALDRKLKNCSETTGRYLLI